MATGWCLLVSAQCDVPVDITAYLKRSRYLLVKDEKLKSANVYVSQILLNMINQSSAFLVTYHQKPNQFRLVAQS